MSPSIFQWDSYNSVEFNTEESNRVSSQFQHAEITSEDTSSTSLLLWYFFFSIPDKNSSATIFQINPY